MKLLYTQACCVTGKKYGYAKGGLVGSRCVQSIAKKTSGRRCMKPINPVPFFLRFPIRPA